MALALRSRLFALSYVPFHLSLPPTTDSRSLHRPALRGSHRRDSDQANAAGIFLRSVSAATAHSICDPDADIAGRQFVVRNNLSGFAAPRLQEKGFHLHGRTIVSLIGFSSLILAASSRRA